MASQLPISFPRVWCMPDSYTFTMGPVQQLLCKEAILGKWIDPFSGKFGWEWAQVTNDIDPEAKAEFHEDALVFLSHQPKERGFDGVLFDPPYSAEMAKRKYHAKGFGGTIGFECYIQQCKDAAAPLIRSGGKAICFGWNSSGFGAKRGFSLVGGLLICHGGSHRDTIVTVEVKQ